MRAIALGVTAFLSLLHEAARANAQTYTCSSTRECRAPLNDAARTRYRSTLTVGSLSSAIAVEASACQNPVVTAQVAVKLAHTSVGDLRLSLLAPDGETSVELFSEHGRDPKESPQRCPGDDIDAVFDDGGDDLGACSATIPAVSGSVLPVKALATLAGQKRVGTWTLIAEDHVRGGGYGALRDWSLTLPCTISTLAVAATQAVASAAMPGVVTFTRGAPFDTDLRVRYALAGSASPEQYVTSAAKVVIPAGSASATLSITPTVEAPGATVVVRPVSGNFSFDADAGATITFVAAGAGAGGVCGDGRQSAGEECDDGNRDNGDGCDDNCTRSQCGNGAVSVGEECDDGNRDNGDGCDNTCHTRTHGCSAAGDASWLVFGIVCIARWLRSRARPLLALGLCACEATGVAPHPLHDIACNAHACVAVGESVVVSNDGREWDEYTGAPTLPALHRVAAGPEGFVAVAKDGALFSSPDGRHWTERSYREPSTDGSNAPKDTLLAVRYAGDRFCVATGNASLLFSSDGALWTRQEVARDFGTQDCAFGNGVFIAVGSPNLVYRSSDGETWTMAATLVGLPSNIVFANGLFVSYLLADHTMYRSTDGRTWQTAALEKAYVVTSMSYGDGVFSALAEGGVVLSSSDAAHWSTQTLDAAGANLRAVAAFVQPVADTRAGKDREASADDKRVVLFAGEHARAQTAAILRVDHPR